jgi:hypothetical protein
MALTLVAALVAGVARAEAEEAPGQIPADLSASRFEQSPKRSVLVPAVETSLMTLAMMGWNEYVGDASWAAISSESIRRNLSSEWVFDDDQYWVNQFAHPYQGTWSFTAARSAGLSFWQSVPFTVLSSYAWEIVGETELPSLNDQITTTFGGVVLGEIFHRSIGMLRRDPGFLRGLAAAVLSPFAAFNHAVLGDWREVPRNPTEMTAWVGAVAFAPDQENDRALGAGAVPDFGLRLVYGPGGDPDTRFERPFDHFELVASYGTYEDPIATLLLRGLVAGAPWETGRGRGLWGAFVGFDLVSPGNYRVSTSHLGVGAVSRFQLAPALALDVDLVVSGVPLGTAGWAWPGEDGKGRDYHMGPGVQATLDARFRLGDRAVASMGVRQYVIVGAKDSVGEERMTYLSASALLRVLGPHALGVEGVLLGRTAETLPEDPTVRESGRILRAFYAYAPASPVPAVTPAEYAKR